MTQQQQQQQIQQLERDDSKLTEEEIKSLLKVFADPETAKRPFYECPFNCVQPARCPWGCYIELQVKKFIDTFSDNFDNNIVIDWYDLITVRKFKKNALIMPYKGRRITMQEVKQRFADTQDSEWLRRHLTLYLQIDDNVFIDSIKFAESGCVINHQMHDCNCYPFVWHGKDGVPMVIIRALRDIEPNERLTMNYNYHATIDSPLEGRECDCMRRDCPMKLSK